VDIGLNGVSTWERHSLLMSQADSNAVLARRRFAGWGINNSRTNFPASPIVGGILSGFFMDPYNSFLKIVDSETAPLQSLSYGLYSLMPTNRLRLCIQRSLRLVPLHSRIVLGPYSVECMPAFDMRSHLFVSW
jgi:hypothetical protein